MSVILFLLTVFGFCFYYCYWKPKRRRRKEAECKRNNISKSGSPKFVTPSHSTKKRSRYDEECSYGGYNYGLSSYSAGYCFHGGFPVTNITCSEQRWQPPKLKMKYQTPYKTNSRKTAQCVKPKSSCEVRVDVNKDRPAPIPCISREFSTESRGSRYPCHLQVIQECEEEKEEDEVIPVVENDFENQQCKVASAENIVALKFPSTTVS